MTLDGAIAHERENAKDHKDKAEYQINRGIEAPQINLHLQSETEQAEYHEQLAEWLEELKDYRERDSNHINEALYKIGYNKAIDDFVAKYKFCDNRSVQCHKALNCADCIAEQLKEGDT